ncbi:efflux RND transporter periplasmic adaptor subunit [Szabonella alba]|uniref:HlyD family efflux transporter periplasmic adaptor subunit n=1 Tax=Szabonella alba TaxID=2804194 RepID=A0A8K0VBM0_9RHOB|nr:HlyD family efflux transporter periplasmic adaptor subunit [Szabonella alba]MBL4916180.1 HlyD family efflux transporter periplasmic adaptor subunit [Szabonella alba]
MRFLTRSLGGLFLLALTLGLLALSGRVLTDAVQTRLEGGGPAMPARERVFTANLMTATPVDFAPVTLAFGEIRSSRTLELRAPRGGEVLELSPGFRDGATVQAGELLVRLDPSDAQAALDLAEVDLANAEAETRDAARALTLARDDLVAAEEQETLRRQALERQREILVRGAGSEATVETAALALSSARQSTLSRASALNAAEARVDQSATALTRAQIALSETERALRETRLHAAFDGVLSGVSVVQGRILGANEALGQLIDPTAMEVAFRLSTTQFGRLIGADGALIDAELSVGLDIAGTEILARGRLDRAGAAVGEGQTGRLVYATLEAAGGFRPGDFVTVRVAEPLLDGVVILPATALGQRGTVLALGNEDRLEELPVTLIRRQDDHVVIEAAAIAGREIVTERSPLLGAGIKVRPVRPEAAPGTPGDTAQDAPGAPARMAATDAAPAMMTLTEDRRARLIAHVEGLSRIPPEARARILAQLAEPEVPARMIERLESRMGG